jgi:hypothetical protein
MLRLAKGCAFEFVHSATRLQPAVADGLTPPLQRIIQGTAYGEPEELDAGQHKAPFRLILLNASLLTCPPPERRVNR